VDGQSVAAIFEVVWILNEMPSAAIAPEISSRNARAAGIALRAGSLDPGAAGRGHGRV
jgi:hypothetical protein